MNFDKRFELLCQEKKTAPTSVGNELGFSKGTISKWRHAKTVPNSVSLKRLAAYFGVSVDYLLGKSDIRNAEADFEDFERAKQILFGTEEVPDKAWWEVQQFVEKTNRKYQIKEGKN